MNKPISPEALLQWRLRLISHLFFYSSATIVRDAWLKGIQHVGWGWFPAEDFCAWFDDLFLQAGPDQALQEGYLNKSEYNLIIPFHEAFRTFANEKETDSKKLLTCASFSRLINEGEQACKKLPHVIKGEAEKEFVRVITKSAKPFWISN
jgi:hypothetical protein